MRRGELANLSGCNIETVRFYEKQGLLPVPLRTTGGHRDYAPEHLRRLTFIRHSRELGFTLDQVRNLLALVDCGNYTCDEVRARTEAHLAEVRRKLKDLLEMEHAMADLVRRCDGGSTPTCAVIASLFQEKR
jgi:MerR family mercuric resistance operon transcriptional regulator